MAINTHLVGEVLAERCFSWTAKDALLYSLSIGAGSSPAVNELHLTTENSYGIEQQVVPTYLVCMGMSNDVSVEVFGDFDLRQVLQGGQRIAVHRPIPPAGSAVAKTRVTGIYDKGKNALIETTTSFIDQEAGDVFGESIGTMVVRGEGGFGGDRGPQDDWIEPAGPADHVVRLATAPTQALLYRLNGDNNPLHSDPHIAQSVGFDRPILHGLCTYGFTARGVVHAALGGDFNLLKGLEARFTFPVVPGETLDVHVWDVDNGVNFRTFVDDRIVLDRGHATF